LALVAETPAAAFEAAERAWLLGACGSLGVQAAVRLGLLGESAQLAQRVAAAGVTLRAPVLALLPAVLSFHLRAAASQLKMSGGGGGATLASSSPDDRCLSTAAAASLSALLPTAVTDGVVLEAPSAILGAMLAACPRAQGTADLFVSLIAAASADDGAGIGALRALPLQQRRRDATMPLSSRWVLAERAASVLERALLAALPKPAETRVRDAYHQSGLSVGAIVIEPMLGRGGVISPPAGFLTELQDFARELGALLGSRPETDPARTAVLGAPTAGATPGTAAAKWNKPSS
jgi:hypothetical protein